MEERVSRGWDWIETRSSFDIASETCFKKRVRVKVVASNWLLREEFRKKEMAGPKCMRSLEAWHLVAYQELRDP